MASLKRFPQPDLITFNDTISGTYYFVPTTFLWVDCTLGAVTVVLPLASSTQPGDWGIIGKWDSSGNIVTVSTLPTLGDLIDGLATKTRTTQFSFLKFMPGTPTTSVYGQGWMTF